MFKRKGGPLGGEHTFIFVQFGGWIRGGIHLPKFQWILCFGSALLGGPHQRLRQSWRSAFQFCCSSMRPDVKVFGKVLETLLAPPPLMNATSKFPKV